MSNTDTRESVERLPSRAMAQGLHATLRLGQIRSRDGDSEKVRFFGNSQYRDADKYRFPRSRYAVQAIRFAVIDDKRGSFRFPPPAYTLYPWLSEKHY